ELGWERGAVGRRVGLVRREVEPEGDHTELLARRNAQTDQIVDGCLAHPDEGVGAPSQRALEAAIEARLERPEIALQDVAVVGVDHQRTVATGNQGRL